MEMTKEMLIKVGLMQVDDDLGSIIGDLNDIESIEGDVYKILVDIVQKKVAKINELLVLKTK